MDRGSRRNATHAPGLLRIEDCLDAEGNVKTPPDVTLISLIERNIANVGDSVAYRFLDYARSADGHAEEVTWRRFGERLAAIGARIQQVASRGERVAILAPQSLEYVMGFYAAVKAGTIAVPLFAPELPGHAERLDTALRDSGPSAVLTTTAARGTVEEFLSTLPRPSRPQVIIIDEIPDSLGESFVHTALAHDEISHLQYTSGSTRPPVGVEITHRAVGTNLVQMILSIDLLDRNTHGVSWLPLYHDMGLSMIGFPAVYGGHSTLMSPAAFVRRPQRWIKALSGETGRAVTAAPNFAYEWTAQRGLPAAGDDIDLSNVVLIIGSEPVSIEAIEKFKPDSWKGYTVGDNTHKELAAHPWHADDEKLMYPFYEKIAKTGIKNVCIHKGLFSPGVAEKFMRSVVMSKSKSSTRARYCTASISRMPASIPIWPRFLMKVA